MSDVPSLSLSGRRRSPLRLLSYVRPHWRRLGLLLLTMAVGVGFELLKPWPTKVLIDQVLTKHEVPSQLQGVLDHLPGPNGIEKLLLWVCIATVVIWVTVAVMEMLMTATSVRLGQRMTFDLGADLYRHLQKLSLLFHSKLTVGDTVARVTADPGCVEVMVTGVFVPCLQAVITLVFMAVIMWRLSPPMTVLSLAVAPFLALTIRVFAEPMKTRFRATRDLEGQMMSMVEQTLSAMPVVQAFTREEREHARYRTMADRTLTAQLRSVNTDMAFKVVVGAVTALGMAGIMFLGGHYVLNGEMTIGTIVVFLAYLQSLYEPLNTLTYMASSYQLAAANADRVQEIFDATPDIDDAPDAISVNLAGNIRFDDVQFGYDPGRPVLKGISLEAHPGQTVAIVGATGAGKTTLVNLLIRFADPQRGHVSIDGHDLRQLKVRSLREQISIVLQDPFIFPISVADNIAYGRPDASREDIVAAAVAARADDFLRALPDGYDTVVSERGASLSGGEKQRISIARAFLKNAPILILDEPTSSLDARTEAQLLEALAALMRDRVTFVIAHRLSTIRDADQILVLDHGRIVEHGRHDELLAREQVYASFYRNQATRARQRPVRAVRTSRAMRRRRRR